MQFFEQRNIARNNTKKVFALFVGGVLCVGGFYALLFELLGHFLGNSTLSSLSLPVGLFFVSIILLGSAYRTAVLTQGGQIIPQEMGAFELPAHSTDFYQQRLQTIVEEIAIASGMPSPRIFILPNENEINAFVSGYSPNTAVITVTYGSMVKLNRHELQGIVAHEFCHILNGDMRLNVIVTGTLFGLISLSLIGTKMLRLLHNIKNKNGILATLPFLLIGVGYIGSCVANLIKYSVSGEREFLADAAAVQFTRESNGISGALKKAAGFHNSENDSNRFFQEFSHFFFNYHAKNNWFSQYFSTHPQILERINRLDPTFTNQSLQRAYERWEKNPPDGMNEDLKLGFSPLAFSPDEQPILVAHFFSHEVAQQILKNIPDEIKTLTKQPFTATALLYALILHNEQNFPHHIFLKTYLEGNVSKNTYEQIEDSLLLLDSVPEESKTALLYLSLSAIRQNSEEINLAVSSHINSMIHLEEQMSLQAYCFAQIINFGIEEWCNPTTHNFSKERLKSHKTKIITLFNTVAFYGQSQTKKAETAFNTGVRMLFPKTTPVYKPLLSGVKILDEVLPPLRKLHPLEQQKLIQCLIAIVCEDGVVTSTEEDLLRVVCAALNCSVPLLRTPT